MEAKANKKQIEGKGRGSRTKEGIGVGSMARNTRSNDMGCDTNQQKISHRISAKIVDKIRLKNQVNYNIYLRAIGLGPWKSACGMRYSLDRDWLSEVS